MVLVRAPARVCVRARMRLPSRVQVRLFVGKESTGVDVGRHGQLGAKVKIVWGHSERHEGSSSGLSSSRGGFISSFVSDVGSLELWRIDACMGIAPPRFTPMNSYLLPSINENEYNLKTTTFVLISLKIDTYKKPFS